MLPQLSMALIVIGANRGVLDGAVHAFDLPVGPRMIGLGEAMIEVMAGAGVFKGMSPKEFAALHRQLDGGSSGLGVARSGEVGAVVGEDGMNAIGDELEQRPQEVGCLSGGGPLDQADERELGSALNGHKEEEFAFLGSDFRQINVEESRWGKS